MTGIGGGADVFDIAATDVVLGLSILLEATMVKARIENSCSSYAGGVWIKVAAK